MSLLGGLFKAVAGPLIGGLLGRKEKAEAQGVDYAKLRDDASAAGFNPLTALLAGGGAGYQREFSPALSSGAFLREAVERGVDTLFNRPGGGEDAAVIRQVDAYRTAKRAAAAADPTRRFGYALTDVRPFSVGSPPVKKPALVDREPADWPRPLVPVRHAVTGEWTDLHPGIAARLGLKDGDTIMAEDFEAIAGDLVSEGLAVGSAAAGALSGGPGGMAWFKPKLPPAGSTPPKSPPRRVPRTYVPPRKAPSWLRP